MEQKNKWCFLPLATAVFSGARLVLEGLLHLATLFPIRAGETRWSRGGAGTVGIIGGADGPTAIFITSRTDNAGPILSAIIFVLSIIVYIYLRKNKLQSRQ